MDFEENVNDLNSNGLEESKVIHNIYGKEDIKEELYNDNEEIGEKPLDKKPIYYNYISRMENKKNMIVSDYWAIFFSSIIYLLFIFILPVLFIKIFNANFTNTLFENELRVKYIFSIVRYVLLTVFVQCIVYTLFFLSAKIQKYSNSLPIIPIVLFIIMTLPLEYLMLKNRYVPVLDFTAGRCYTFILENVVKWEAIILHNLHLIVYLIIYFWLLINFISSKMEFIENENNNN